MTTHHNPDQAALQRLMTRAVEIWDGDLIRSAAAAGAETTDLLIKAVTKNDMDMAAFAIERGANVRARVASANFTPLIHYAHAAGARIELVDLLLKEGVNIDTPDASGDTVARLAARKGDFARMQSYLDRGADLKPHAQEIFFQAIRGKSLPHVYWAVENGADPNGTVIKDNSVLNGLHLMSEFFDEKVADYLLALGLDVDMRTPEGNTTLFLISQQPQPQTVAYFLERGADPLAANHAGQTPADMAMARHERSSSRQTKEVLILMLDKIRTQMTAKKLDMAAGRDVEAIRQIGFSKKPPTLE